MMEFTGERFVPQIDGNIKYEHLYRYALALEFAEGRSVLDIASGEGYGSALLAKRATCAIGIDIDLESVNHAQAQYGYLTNLKFLVGSCRAVPDDADSLFNVASYFPPPMYFVAVCSNRKKFLSANLKYIYFDTSDVLDKT